MTITYEYKLQGNGKDSWVKIITNDNGIEVEKSMVYEDPYKSELIKLFEKATPEELNIIKNKLK